MTRKTNYFQELSSDNQALGRLVLMVFGLVIVAAVAFGGYYYWDRYVALGDQSPLELGVEHLEGVIRENPEDVEARLSLAQYYLENGAYADAINQSQQILQAFPDNDNAQFVLGMAYIQSGQMEPAVAPLEKFAAVRRESPMAHTDTVLETALYFLGENYLKLEKPEQAIPVLEEALQINATDADAMYQLGMAYSLTGQHEQAITQFEAAVRFVPDFTEAYHGMIASYSAMGSAEYVAYARGMEAYSMQDFNVALTHLQSAADSLPEFAPAFVGLGLVQEQMGDLDAAKANLARALELEPDNFMANHALGRIQQLLEQSS